MAVGLRYVLQYFRPKADCRRPIAIKNALSQYTRTKIRLRQAAGAAQRSLHKPARTELR